MFKFRLVKLTANVPPALCQAGIFITDVYKYTEKFERKNLTSEKKVQTLALPDTHPNPACTKPLLCVVVYLFSSNHQINLS